MPGAAASPSPTPVLLPDRFAELCESSDGVALEFFGAAMSFPDLARPVDRLGSHLRSEGVTAGDRVVLQQQNTPEFVIASLAIWSVGAAIVPVSPMYGAREMRHIVSDSGATAWIGAAAVFPQVAETLAESPIRAAVLTDFDHFAVHVPEQFADAEPATVLPTVDGLAISRFADVVGSEQPAFERVAARPEAIALIAYTSGTTGDPKGAIISHRNVAVTAHEYPRSGAVEGSDEKILAMAPLVHITGFAMHFGAWLATGATLVLGYRFQPDVYLDIIERSRVTWTTGAATAYIALLQAMGERERDTSSLRFLGCGGGPVPTAVAAQITRVMRAPLHPGYGLTESTGGVVSFPVGMPHSTDPDSGIISVGVPLGATELVIRREDGSIAAAGERGEVTLRGLTVIDGYWQNPAATAETLRDGWLYTGDVGFVNEAGHLFLVDRTKDVIIASGYKVWPREVEDVLYEHPHVREAAVVGSPDDYRGETVKAYVVAREGWTPDPQQLIGHCRAQLAPYKVPRLVEFVDALPKNANGKILHRELRALAAEQAKALR